MFANLYILILAGGSGERFWPLSRKAAPKQLLKLLTDESLLENTINRMAGFVSKSNILVLTNRDQEAAVRKVTTMLPAENVVAEPDKRDTAAAVALGVALVARRNPTATMIILPADHLINDHAAFCSDLQVAVEASEASGALVTIGIKPTWACPGFGYIEEGAKLEGSAHPLYEVDRFREKPNPDLAESFLRAGNFRWNAGMFIWTIPAILSELQRQAPQLGEFVTRMQRTEDFEGELSREFSKLKKISIDYAVLENARRVLVLEASFDWDDVGSWLAVAAYLPNDAANNRSNTLLTTIDSADNVVFSANKRHVALLGVSELIVVESNDALLIANRHEAEKIKALIGKIPLELQ